MAETPKRKRKLRPASATVREKAEIAANKSAEKPKRVRGAVKKTVSPIVWLWRLICRIFRPFRFLLWPFKTRPMRWLGRVLSHVLLLRYFRNSWKELKLVTWPNRKQTTQLTIAVFAFAIAFGLAVAITDYGLDKIFKRILIK